MTEEAISYIMQKMAEWLDNNQMIRLEKTLDEMPVEQVQRLLSHEKIDTTLHYAMVKQSNVKMAHKKFLG